MKILYIHQYFCTPEESGSTRSYWIARQLVSKGHEVVMVTSSNKNHPKSGIERIDGIEVHYIRNPYDNSMSKLSKIRSFVKFLYKAIRESSKIKGIDKVFATSTPLTIGGVALALKSIKGWPYVFEVRDLWPEFPIQMGAVRNKTLIRLLRNFEKKIYRNANHIIALSPGMRAGVMDTGIPGERVSMVPNMSKPEEFFPRNPDEATAQKFGIDPKKFNVIHFGSMGPANALEYIIEAARIFKEYEIDDVEFIFMGHGATLPRLKALVEKYGLDNVKFLGSHPMKTVSEVVNLCSASITTFKNLPILKTNSPNKLFDSLSAAKPIIVNSAGWTKELVENEECGFYADPENPRDLVDKIIKYRKETAILKKWSENARKLSETTFNRAILADKAAEIIITC